MTKTSKYVNASRAFVRVCARARHTQNVIRQQKSMHMILICFMCAKNFDEEH